MTATRLALAQLRVTGVLPVDAVTADELVAATGQVGRRVRRVDGAWRWGWDDMHEPDADGPDVAGLTGFAAAILAAVLAHAWPDPTTEPWPGEPLLADIVDRIARAYDRDRKIVQKFLTLLTDLGLLTAGSDGLLRLGHQMATLAPRTVTVLRQEHHRLADIVRDGTR